MTILGILSLISYFDPPISLMLKQPTETNQQIPLLYQDQNLLIANKPSGLLVHAYRKESNERIHLLRLLKQQTGEYLYPIHRIDRPVSGIVLFGLNGEIINKLQQYWHHESTVKQYLALVKGVITEAGQFNFPLLNEQKQKQEALTLYEPLRVFNEVTLLKIQIKTGRKHQIRRHFSRRCSNVIGDKKYGQGKLNRLFKEEFQLNRIFLHSHYLKIFNPGTEEFLEVRCPLPEELEQTLQLMEKSELDQEV